MTIMNLTTPSSANMGTVLGRTTAATESTNYVSWVRGTCFLPTSSASKEYVPPFPNHFLSSPTLLEASLLSPGTNDNTTDSFTLADGTQVSTNFTDDEKKKKRKDSGSSMKKNEKNKKQKVFN